MTYVSVSRATIAPHEARLRACGFLRLAGAGGAGLRGALHAAWRAAALALTSFYLLQELIYSWEVCHDIDALAQVMFLLLCHVTSLCKQIYFHTHADRIDDLINMLNDPAFEHRGRGEARALLARRRAADAQLVRAYSGAALATCALWAGEPLLARAAAADVSFPLRPAPRVDTAPRFVVMVVYVNAVTALVGVANTTMDAFIAAFLAQAATQLKILKLNLERLCEDARAAAAEATSEDDFDATFKRLLVSHLKHYNQIKLLVKTVEDIFGFPIFVQFSIGGWILCMAVYRIVSLGGGVNMNTMSMSMFTLCILTEMFLYCYYGNEVSVESASVSWSLYACGWERARGGGRGARGGGGGARLVSVSLGAARRDVAVRALLLVPLTLSTYITILRSSYTFYTLLKQTK